MSSSTVKVLALVPYGHDTAPGQRFRAEQWARSLEGQAEFQFAPFESARMKRILYLRGRQAEKAIELGHSLLRRAWSMANLARSCDVIYLFRELAPVGPAVLERALAMLGKPIVFDFDDAIYVPSVSEANRRFQWLKCPQKTDAICRFSTHVIVGNDYLKRYAENHAKQVSILPTTIDTEAYQPKTSVAISGTPVIGWSGSLTTASHLKASGPALQDLRLRLPFRLSVVGSQDFSLPGLEASSKSWSAETEIADIKAFDIGVMPLPDDEWSRGKCGLKALQYMALGVPTIASPVGVNAEIIKDGHNGFLASSRAEWVEKLALLIRDEPLRRRFAAEARRTVEGWYSAKIQAPRFLQILRQAASAAPVESDVKSQEIFSTRG